MALNTSGILSNVKAQGQKIFGYAKGGLVEEGILSNSINKAVNSVSSTAKGNYDEVVKGIAEVKKDMPYVPNDPEGSLKTFQNIAKDKDGSIFGIGKAMSDDQAQKVKEASAMRMVKKTNGLNADDNMKTYDGLLKSTKGMIAGSTAKNMGEQYFVNPVKDLIKANKSGNKDAANKALNKVVARTGTTSGAVGGVVGSVAILANAGDGEESMRY